MSSTYDGFRLGSPTVAYPYLLVRYEVLAVCSAVILWGMTLGFTEGVDGSLFEFTHSEHQKRKLILLPFSIYHAFAMLYFLFLQGDLTRNTFRYYYQLVRYWVGKEKKYPIVESDEIKLRYVLMRNMIMHALVDSNLLLIWNYLSEDSVLYCFLLLAFSLGMTFLYVMIIYQSVLYLAAQPSLGRERFFIWLLSLSTVVFILFTILSVDPIYMAYLREVNSMWGETLLEVNAGIILTSVFMSAVISVFVPTFVYSL